MNANTSYITNTGSYIELMHTDTCLSHSKTMRMYTVAPHPPLQYTPLKMVEPPPLHTQAVKRDETYLHVYF